MPRLFGNWVQNQGIFVFLAYVLYYLCWSDDDLQGLNMSPY